MSNIDKRELLGAQKHANQHRLSRLTMEVHTDELRIMASAVEGYTNELIAALEAAKKRIAELRDWNLGLAQESFERQQRIAELQSVNDELKKFPDQIVNYVAKLGTSEIGCHTKNVIYRAAQKVKDSAAGIGKGE